MDILALNILHPQFDKAVVDENAGTGSDLIMEMSCTGGVGVAEVVSVEW